MRLWFARSLGETTLVSPPRDGGIKTLLLTAQDANRFLQDRPTSSGRVVALAPDARVALVRADVPHETSTDAFGDRGHRRAVVRVRRAERDLAAHQPSRAFSPAAWETLLTLFHIRSACAARAWETLGSRGPWLLMVGGDWTETNDRSETLVLLVRKILDGQDTAPPAGRPGLWDRWVRALSRLAARQLADRPTMLLSGRSYGLRRIEGLIAEKYPDTTCMHLRAGQGSFKDAAKALASVISPRTYGGTVLAVPEGAPDVRAEAERILMRVKDPVVRRAVAVFGPGLAGQVARTAAIAEEMSGLIEAMSPRGVLSHSFRWVTDAALGEAAQAQGIPALLLSHGSHPVPQTAFSRSEHAALARGLLASRFSSLNLLQSPHAEAAARSLFPGASVARCRATMWGRHPEPRRSDPVRERESLILHAGTYKPWASCRPWIYETSDEFLEGLAVLVEAVSRIAGTRLVIRIRPQPECGLEALSALLPKADNVELRSEGSFLEDLEKADVLVSYASTTIEEALHARTPVVLWGGSRRYKHLEASTHPPTAEARSCVYAPQRPDQLGSFLDAVLSAHRSSPLSDGELQDHVWPDSVSGLDHFLRAVLPGGRSTRTGNARAVASPPPMI